MAGSADETIIVNLAHLVKRISGHSHYNEIAELVLATTSLHRPDTKKTFTADDIRKIISHYGKI